MASSTAFSGRVRKSLNPEMDHQTAERIDNDASSGCDRSLAGHLLRAATGPGGLRESEA